jgi:hypothetical protein
MFGILLICSPALVAIVALLVQAGEYVIEAYRSGEDGPAIGAGIALVAALVMGVGAWLIESGGPPCP